MQKSRGFIKTCLNEYSTQAKIKPYSEIPGPKSYPLVGALSFLRDPRIRKGGINDMFADYHHKYGPVFKLRIFNIETVSVLGPENFKTVYQASGLEKAPFIPGFENISIYRKKIRSDLWPKTGGLLGETGDGWYEVRTAVQQDMLRPKTAHIYTESLTRISDHFLDMLETNLKEDRQVPDDMIDLLFKWSFESISKIFLDRNMAFCPAHEQAPEKDEIVKATTELISQSNEMNIASPIWKVFPALAPWLKPIHKNTDIIYHAIQKYTNEAIDEIKAGKRDTDPNSKSIIKKFLENPKVTKEIIDTVAFDGILAGIDTTAVTVGFLLYNLSTYPDVQEKLHQEILTVCGNEKSPTAEDIGKMKYLRACMRESHRLTPTVSGSTRTLESDVVCSGFEIPAKTQIIMSWYTTNYMEEYFQEPKSFKPERFLRGSGLVDPFASIPFGHGSRSCIGRRFAELEIALLVVRTLQKFRLEYPENEPKEMPILMEFINKPGKPYKYKMIPRS